MDYEIIRVTEPDAKDFRRVDYRTADGQEHAVRYTPSSDDPRRVVEDSIEWEAFDRAAAKRPPGNFRMFVKMNCGYKSFEELKQDYIDFAHSRGYEVDGEMRPYKPVPA